MAVDNNVWFVIITTMGAAVSGLFVQIMQYVREGRQHRWLIEQSQFEQQERVRIAKELKVHTDANRESLATKIDENTEMNKVALDAANDVNKKILAIGELRQKSTFNDRR